MDEIMKKTRGIALTAVTPFKSDGSVDDAGIHRLVEFLVQHGLNGNNGFLVPISTAGNFLSLSLEERKHVADVFLKASEGLVSIVVGCNHIRLSEIIELAKFSQDRGAVGIMVGPPFYWKPTEDQIIEHYHQICRNTDTAVLIYNNHWASQVDLSVETFGRILENPKVIGLKESTHSVIKLRRVVRQYARRINILNGLGEAYEPTYKQLGCEGFTSTMGNILPEPAVRLQSLMEDSQFEKARELADRLQPISDFLDSLTGGQYIAALKHVLNRLGVCNDTVRPPITPLTGSHIASLEKIMEAY